MAGKLFGVKGEANSLWSGATAPVEREARTLEGSRAALLGVAMSFSLPVYLYASCLSALGAGVTVVLGASLAGGLVVAVLAVLCGHAGVRYGIPFAVLARSAFGVLGARLPVALRLLIGCAWVGIECWLCGWAIWYAFVIAAGSALPPDVLWVCFAVVLLVVAAPWRGSRYAFAGVVTGACLLLVLVVSYPVEWMARGWKLSTPDPLVPVWPTLPAGHGILLGTTALLGLWLPVALGSADGGRLFRSQRAHAWGAGSMCVAGVLFSGVIAATARMTGGGHASWSPLLLAGGAGRTEFAVLCLLALAVAALLTARSAGVWIAAGVAELVPGRVSAGGARWLVRLAAALSMPWRLVSAPEVYLSEWLSGCAGLLAPVAAILLVEYFGLRRRWLNVDDLYQRDGLYEYSAGWNVKAFGAVGAGWIAMLTLLYAPSLVGLREGAVWLGTAVSVLLYWLLRSGPPDVAQIPPTPLLIPLAGFEGEGASG